MKLLILMSSMLFLTNTTVPDHNDHPELHSETSYLSMDECHLFHSIFGTVEDKILCIDAISVLELEEELNLDEFFKVAIEKTSYFDMNESFLFYSIFGTIEEVILEVEDITVLEIEEVLDLDTKAYLLSRIFAHQKPESCITKLTNL